MVSVLHGGYTVAFGGTRGRQRAVVIVEVVGEVAAHVGGGDG